MARFDPIIEVVDDLCLRSGDLMRRKKGLYLSCCTDTWNDLNETTLKIAKRLKIPIRKEVSVNKRTNSLDLPCNSNRVSSVNVIDERGVMHVVYRNIQLSDDIVEVPAEKNCACEKKCGYNLCNTIKGYVAVQTTVSDILPNGNPISFNAISRLAVGENGVVYRENQGIQRVYTNSIWTDTVLVTTSTQMCQCETDDNGCICDTEQNVNILCESCGIRNFQNNINPYNLTTVTEPYAVGGTAMCPPSPNDNEWVYYCDNKMDWFSIQCGCEPGRFRREYRNVYNISENGNRLVFPHDFGFEKALVRFYEDIDLKNLLIPYIAKDTFMTGVQYFSMKQNPDMRDMAASFGQQYSREKWGLFLELNKMRIAELGKTIAPAAYVPSYKDHRTDRYWGYYY